MTRSLSVLIGVVLAAASTACARTEALAPVASAALSPPRGDYRNDPFLDDLEQRTFRWFWDTTNPRNGLVPDRWPTKSFSSIAAVGFALSAYPVAAERGWVPRAQAADRALTTLRFFYTAPQTPDASNVTGFKGFYYHFLDMETGYRFRTVELSTIDTALLLAGALAAQSYFDGPGPTETAVRAYADSMYRRADWTWAEQSMAPLVSMGWTPEQTTPGTWGWRGYDEAMLLYVLALGSPTHAIEPAAWSAWTATYKWGTYYGLSHVGFAPLFGHEYSHIWIDFRGIGDAFMREKGLDYFENSRRATYAQRAYAIANPNRWRAYGSDVWGLTACDGPFDATLTADGVPRRFYGYAARGADFTEVRDDGTIAPTAAGGAIPFAPEIALPALKAMRDRWGDKLYTRYGFLDAFNPTLTPDVAGTTKLQNGTLYPQLGWVDGDYLGIDQGPILLMIENYRSGLLWRVMRRNPYIVKGLQRAGFAGGWLDGTPPT
ncbi:MAG: glucoamylase family protein [Gemmatimonadaceae bacterium]